MNTILGNLGLDWNILGGIPLFLMCANQMPIFKWMANVFWEWIEYPLFFIFTRVRYNTMTFLKMTHSLHRDAYTYRLTKSRYNIWIGYPFFFMFTESESPSARTCDVTKATSNLVGVFVAFGRIQRMKWRFCLKTNNSTSVDFFENVVRQNMVKNWILCSG